MQWAPNRRMIPALKTNNVSLKSKRAANAIRGPNRWHEAALCAAREKKAFMHNLRLIEAERHDRAEYNSDIGRAGESMVDWLVVVAPV